MKDKDNGDEDGCWRGRGSLGEGLSLIGCDW